MCTVDGRLDVNVALNRPSYLSTSLVTYEATNGNDGQKSNPYCNALFPAHSVAGTDEELAPWFGVDLGVALHVAGVNLTNRADRDGK